MGDIEHLDGHLVHVSREKITWPGARIRKKGEGMPNYENNNLFGTMYITFDVAFPKGGISESDKQTISKMLNQDPINAVYNGLGGFKPSLRCDRKTRNEPRPKIFHFKEKIQNTAEALLPPRA